MAGGFVMASGGPASHLPPPTKSSWILIALTVMAVMGGFLFGYDTGIVSGAMILIRSEMKLDDLWQELIVSVTVGAAAVGSLVAQIFNNRFGRKWTILGSSLLFIIGSAILAGSPNANILLVGRIVLGIAIGISSSTIPSYVAECSPAHVRGRMTTMFQLMITFGFWCAGLIAGGLSYLENQDTSWRVMLGLAAVPALVQLIGFFFMPESPRWLATHGREAEAYEVIKRIYGGDHLAEEHAKFEIEGIRKGEEDAYREKEAMGFADQPAIIAIFRTPHLVKALIIGCTLMMFQQLSGINTVMYYSATIIMMSGVSSEQLAIWLAAVTSGVNFFCTFIGLYLVEKIGRRLLILCSIVGVFLCLIILGISFAVIAKQSPNSVHRDVFRYNGTNDWYGVSVNGTDINDTCLNYDCDECSYKIECGWCYHDDNWGSSGTCVAHSTEDSSTQDNTKWAEYGDCWKNLTGNFSFLDQNPNTKWNYGYCPTTLSWLPILGMVLYLCCFSAGYGPMPWVINAEIFPNWARGTGTSLSTTVNWLFNLLISLTFLTLARAITRQGAYFLYAGITLIGLVWFYFVLPETKNKEIEDIQELLMGPWFARGKEPARKRSKSSYGGTAESETSLNEGKRKDQSPLEFRAAGKMNYPNAGYIQDTDEKSDKF